MQSLKDERRLLEDDLEGVVLQAVLVKRVVEGARAAGAEMKHVDRSLGPPFGDSLGSEEPVAFFGERERRRQQHETVDSVRKQGGGMDGDDSAQAGAYERNRTGFDTPDLAAELVDHACHRQRGKIRLVEIRALE